MKKHWIVMIVAVVIIISEWYIHSNHVTVEAATQSATQVRQATTAAARGDDRFEFVDRGDFGPRGAPMKTYDIVRERSTGACILYVSMGGPSGWFPALLELPKTACTK